MKSSNVKHPIEWKHVRISEISVNGVKIPVMLEIQTPVEGLYMVTVDREGKELSRVQVPLRG